MGGEWGILVIFGDSPSSMAVSKGQRQRVRSVQDSFLQSSGSGGSVDGGHRLDVSGQRSGVDGSAGLGSVDALMGNRSHNHSGSMGMGHHSGSVSGMDSHRGTVSGMDSHGSRGVDSCVRPGSHGDGGGPVGSGNAPGRGHHSGSRDGGVGQTMASHLRQQRDHGGLHAHGKGQGEDNGDGELNR